VPNIARTKTVFIENPSARLSVLWRYTGEPSAAQSADEADRAAGER